MKTIVTGGCGFIGSHVVELLLRRGHAVTVLDSMITGRRSNLEGLGQQVEVVECDLGVSGDWAGTFACADWVIHLAALADIVPSIERPDSYFRSNVVGTFNVLEAARAANVNRLVYAASSSCYGLPDSYPTPETAPIRPQYPYALTKRLGEELVLHWAHLYGLRALSLRLFNVYGPRSRTSGTYGAVFGVFLAQKLAGKPFTIVGDGTQTRDFTYVTDVAEAVHAAAASDIVGQVYNVGSGDTVSVNSVADLLGGPRVHIPKRPAEPNCTLGDISRIRAEIGWQPQVPIEQGVAEMVSCIDYWRDAPVWEPESIARETAAWFKYLTK